MYIDMDKYGRHKTVIDLEDMNDDDEFNDLADTPIDDRLYA